MTEHLVAQLRITQRAVEAANDMGRIWEREERVRSSSKCAQRERLGTGTESAARW
jgi:hypothetical protein